MKQITDSIRVFLKDGDVNKSKSITINMKSGVDDLIEIIIPPKSFKSNLRDKFCLHTP